MVEHASREEPKIFVAEHSGPFFATIAAQRTMWIPVRDRMLTLRSPK